MPLKAGDIVYLSAKVPSLKRTTQTLYLTSTGTLNHDLGALEVEEDEEPEVRSEAARWCTQNAPSQH